jgi:mannan polymerase II complex MNN10 subunit
VINFINEVRAVHDRFKAKGENTPSEQGCMLELLDMRPEGLQNMQYIPQWKLNAFPEEIRCYDKDQRKWEYGMLLIHFAGAWAHVQGDDPTGQLMERYEPEIIWEEVRQSGIEFL